MPSARLTRFSVPTGRADATAPLVGDQEEQPAGVGIGGPFGPLGPPVQQGPARAVRVVDQLQVHQATFARTRPFAARLYSTHAASSMLTNCALSMLVPPTSNRPLTGGSSGKHAVKADRHAKPWRQEQLHRPPLGPGGGDDVRGCLKRDSISLGLGGDVGGEGGVGLPQDRLESDLSGNTTPITGNQPRRSGSTSDQRRGNRAFPLWVVTGTAAAPALANKAASRSRSPSTRGAQRRRRRAGG